MGYFKEKTYNSKGDEIYNFKICDSSCNTCTDSNTCTSCYGGYRLINGKCYAPCSEKYAISKVLNHFLNLCFTKASSQILMVSALHVVFHVQNV